MLRSYWHSERGYRLHAYSYNSYKLNTTVQFIYCKYRVQPQSIMFGGKDTLWNPVRGSVLLIWAQREEGGCLLAIAMAFKFMYS